MADRSGPRHPLCAIAVCLWGSCFAMGFGCRSASPVATAELRAAYVDRSLAIFCTPGCPQPHFDGRRIAIRRDAETGHDEEVHELRVHCPNGDHDVVFAYDFAAERMVLKSIDGVPVDHELWPNPLSNFVVDPP